MSDSVKPGALMDPSHILLRDGLAEEILVDATARYLAREGFIQDGDAKRLVRGAMLTATHLVFAQESANYNKFPKSEEPG